MPASHHRSACSCRGASLHNIHPCRPGEFRHSLGRDFDRATRRARACDDQVELPEQHIAIAGSGVARPNGQMPPTVCPVIADASSDRSILALPPSTALILPLSSREFAAGDEHNTALADPE